MTTSNVKWIISEKIGSVSGIVQYNNQNDCILILGHGAGAGMYHPFMQQLADALFGQNIGVIRYQFPYMEQGKRRPDFPAVALKTIETIVSATQEQYNKPIFLAGKSFGGRMASTWTSKSEDPGISGLVFYGFPLHSVAKVNTDRAEHLAQIEVPMLFLQGTRDRLAKQELIEEVVGNLPSAKLEFFQEADHSFKVPKRTGYSHEDIINMLALNTRKWINHIL